MNFSDEKWIKFIQVKAFIHFLKGGVERLYHILISIISIKNDEGDNFNLIRAIRLLLFN
jgi:hypothetical protein